MAQRERSRVSSSDADTVTLVRANDPRLRFTTTVVENLTLNTNKAFKVWEIAGVFWYVSNVEGVDPDFPTFDFTHRYAF